MKLRELNLVSRRSDLREIPAGKILINTINAYSYVCAQKDEEFAEALMGGDYLVPDGVSIVMATRFVGNPNPPQQRVPGWDVFMYEMEKLHSSAKENEGKRKTVMFMGSSEHVLSAIRERVAREYPGLDVITYSPPFREEFSEEDSARMVAAVNNANPDLLLIGMTAPKQEKWVSRHWRMLDINCNVCTIGAVFDFYAGTSKRAPLVMQKFGLEWLHRLCSDPRRMWRRYIIGNTRFVMAMLRERLLPGNREKTIPTPPYRWFRQKRLQRCCWKEGCAKLIKNIHINKNNEQYSKGICHYSRCCRHVVMLHAKGHSIFSGQETGYLRSCGSL